MFITKAVIEKYGRTPRCKGCAALNRGDTAKAHDEHCRVRIEQMIKDSGTIEEQGRLMMSLSRVLKRERRG